MYSEHLRTLKLPLFPAFSGHKIVEMYSLPFNYRSASGCRYFSVFNSFGCQHGKEHFHKIWFATWWKDHDHSRSMKSWTITSVLANECQTICVSSTLCGHLIRVGKLLVSIMLEWLARLWQHQGSKNGRGEWPRSRHTCPTRALQPRFRRWGVWLGQSGFYNVG